MHYVCMYPQHTYLLSWLSKDIKLFGFALFEFFIREDTDFTDYITTVHKPCY